MQGFYSNYIALVLLWWLNGVLRGDSASLHTSHSVCWPKASLAGSGTLRWDLARNHENRWTASMAIQQLWINVFLLNEFNNTIFSPLFMPMELCKCATLGLYLRWLVCRIMLETFMMVTMIFFSFCFRLLSIIQIISNVLHKDLPVPCVCSRQLNFRPHSFRQSHLHRKRTGSWYDKEQNQMENEERKKTDKAHV